MDLNWQSSVFAIIAIIILMVLLRKFIFNNLFSVMEKRRQLVLDEMNSAKQSNEQASELAKQASAELDKTRADAMALIENARVQAVRQVEQLKSQANDDIARMKVEAQAVIENDREQAVAQLKREVAILSVSVAKHLIVASIDDSAATGLVDAELEKVGWR